MGRQFVRLTTIHRPYCVCFGLCGDLLKSEFSLANDPAPGGGGFNDDDDWRGTVRTTPTIRIY